MKIAYDFHLHSCLSPCGDMDMTPANIAGMAFINGLNAIALTDHNSVKNCAALKNAATKYGIVTLFGMELTTAEEVHVVCLFADKSAADEWGEYVYKKLLKIKNKPEIFGHQIIMDSLETPLGEEENLLINATEIPFDGVFAPVASLGGVALPAHIDKSANSLLSNLGFVPQNSTFNLAEFKNLKNLDNIVREHPYFEGCKFISNSDAHYLQDINLAENYIEVEELSAHAIIESLKNPF